MTGTAASTGNRKYLVDVTVPRDASDGFDLLRRGWDKQVGTAIPLPPSQPVGAGDYRVRIRHSKVDDAVVEELYSESIAGGTGGHFNHLNDRMVLHLVRQGEWRFVRSPERGTTVVPANQFVLRHNDPSWRFEVEPHTTARVLILPTRELRPLVGDRVIVGPADSPEVRLLNAHVDVLGLVLNDLSASGVAAAREAMIELVKGVLTRSTDADEPTFTPALIEVAKDAIGRHLADPEFSPRVLARELNVSVRTLHRAFARTDESVTTYLRRRRLEQARLDLTAPGAARGIAELAAHWRFADSSHFIRAFKQEYGETPTQYARLRRTGGPEQTG
jgi:AraC-like DNA-binding protein